MIKILPLLIIPIFFLIVYSGVKNLTQNKLDDVVKVTEIQESLNDNLDSDLSLKTEAIKRKKEGDNNYLYITKFSSFLNFLISSRNFSFVSLNKFSSNIIFIALARHCSVPSEHS